MDFESRYYLLLKYRFHPISGLVMYLMLALALADLSDFSFGFFSSSSVAGTFLHNILSGVGRFIAIAVLVIALIAAVVLTWIAFWYILLPITLAASLASILFPASITSHSFSPIKILIEIAIAIGLLAAIILHLACSAILVKDFKTQVVVGRVREILCLCSMGAYEAIALVIIAAIPMVLAIKALHISIPKPTLTIMLTLCLAAILTILIAKVGLGLGMIEAGGAAYKAIGTLHLVAAASLAWIAAWLAVALLKGAIPPTQPIHLQDLIPVLAKYVPRLDYAIQLFIGGGFLAWFIALFSKPHPLLPSLDENQ